MAAARAINPEGVRRRRLNATPGHLRPILVIESRLHQSRLAEPSTTTLRGHPWDPLTQYGVW